MATEKKQKTPWFPLESNPDVMNKYAASLGLNSCGIQFQDVFGLDDELLAWVPHPVFAVLFVFPLSGEVDEAGEDEKEAKGKAPLPEPQSQQTQGPLFIAQTIPNACGTIAILHALVNCRYEALSVEPKSVLGQFMEKCATGTTPLERAAYLEKSDDLHEAHSSAASEGQTSNRPPETRIDLHFVCYLEFGGVLFEMDGRKPRPLAVGQCTPDHVLEEAACAIKARIAVAKGSNSFGVVALAKSA